MSIEQSDAYGRVDPILLSRMGDVIDQAVRKIRTHLINRIGMDVPIRFGEIGYIPVAELLEQFEEEGSGIYIRFEFEPGGHIGLLAVDGALLYRVMGLLLGEDPYAEPSPYTWRPPTRMDLRVAERLASDIFSGLLDGLPPNTGGKIRILDISGNHRVDLRLSSQATLLDVPLDFGPPEDPYGIVTLAMPAGLTHTLWPNYQAERAPSDQGVHRVLPLPVTVVAELGRVTLSLGQVERLAEGDVLSIGRTGPVRLTVHGRPAVVGQAGLSGNTRCIQVLDRAMPA